MQPHTTDVSNFGSVSAAFVDAGFPERDLLPLIPPGAALSPNSKVHPVQLGKIPGRYTGDGWCGLTGAWPTMGLDLATVTNAKNWRTPNVGLRAAGFPAIDIDTGSEAGWALAERAMQGVVATDGPVRTRGGAPRALCMYKLAEGSEPIRKRKLEWEDAEGVKHAVEVLGLRQQYAVAGVHPSGSAYVWDRQPEADKLPELSVQGVEAYMERLKALITETGGTVVSNSKQGAGSGLEIDYTNADPLLPDELVMQALDYIPNNVETLPTREDILRVLASAKTALGRNAEGMRYDIEAWASRYGWADTDYFDQLWDSISTSRTPADHLTELARQKGFPRAGAVLDFADCNVDEMVVPTGNITQTALSALVVPEKAIPNVAAIAEIFRQCAPGSIKFDEMTLKATLMNDPRGGADFKPRALGDKDVLVLLDILQRGGLSRARKETVRDALELVASENPFHPVRDYLEGLEWDGVERMPTMFSKYCGAEDTPYTRGVGSFWLISAVARVMVPGCKVDNVLTLCGKQGAGKSRFAKTLFSPWYSPRFPAKLESKDAAIHLRGRWGVEISEGWGLRQADQNAMKAFLTTDEDQVRLPHDKFDTDTKRQCIFIITTNDKHSLRDHTGARRFLPITTGDEFDIDALARDRDQLFAEAYARYTRGEKHFPSREFEAQYAREEQEAHFEADAWEDPIANYLEANAGEVLTLQDIAFNALGIPAGQMDKYKQGRVTAILERLGWERKRTNKIRGWVKG